MVSMQIAALVLAIAGADDTVLLDFHAPWCGPCRSMEGVIGDLEQAGYPIRRVNVDRDRALAAQHRVTSIPCYVLLVNGQEAGRITGASRRSELLALFSQKQVTPASAAAQVARAQSPDSRPAVGLPARPAVGPLSSDRNLPPGLVQTAATPHAAAPAATTATPEQLIAATVRLTIEDAQGKSHGTGTMVDSRQGEALVLTCGHLFRDSQGKGTIQVDLCDPRSPRSVPGRLISFDLKSDVALVSIRPGGPVQITPIASRGCRIAKGDPVTSVGCNNGGEPTAVASQITSINKFLGPPNLQVAGQPVQGRSGGGLFSRDGRVIGVCNAADPADNEGLYAALAAIHAHLDEKGLAALVDTPSSAPSGASLASNVMPPAAQPPAVQVAVQPMQTSGAGNAAWGAATARDATAGALNAAERSILAAVDRAPSGAEVICIVRPLADPSARSEVIKLDRASPAFLRQLAADQEAQQSRHLTSLAVPRR